jgi:hypothetical protein
MLFKINHLNVAKIVADILVVNATLDEIKKLYDNTIYQFWHYFRYVPCMPKAFIMNEEDVKNIQVNSYEYKNDTGIYRLLSVIEENNTLTARILVNNHEKENYKYYTIIKAFTGDNESIAYYIVHSDEFDVLVDRQRTLLKNILDKSKYINSASASISYLKKDGRFYINAGLIASLDYIFEATYRVNSGVMSIRLSHQKFNNAIECRTKYINSIDEKIQKLLAMNGCSELIIKTEAMCVSV